MQGDCEGGYKEAYPGQAVLQQQPGMGASQAGQNTCCRCRRRQRELPSLPGRLGLLGGLQWGLIRVALCSGTDPSGCICKCLPGDTACRVDALPCCVLRCSPCAPRRPLNSGCKPPLCNNSATHYQPGARKHSRPPHHPPPPTYYPHRLLRTMLAQLQTARPAVPGAVLSTKRQRSLRCSAVSGANAAHLEWPPLLVGP
jgi:hypothetical protein